jgi:polygalacturonase
MTKKLNNLFATAASAQRKSFHKTLMLAAASLSLAAVTLPAAAASWWDATPHISIGSRTINARNKGALGNGRHDDTAAIQAAINALPSTGGTVYLPAGKYMVNARKAIRMRSHTRLKLASTAQINVIPNSVGRYHAIKVWNVNNVQIVGGSIVGDRARHRGSSGEWGYGINIQGSRHVLVNNVHLSNFWGDGMWIGATGWGRSLSRSDYVTLNHVVSSNNRRQGLSIGPAHHVYVVNSTFKDTHGTLPQAGIDIEPQDQGPADTIRIENTTMSGNRGNGLELHYHISGIVLTHSIMKNNNGFGALAVSAPYVNLVGNTATRNGLAGVGMSGTSHHGAVKNNALKYNSTHYISPTRGGGGKARDIQIGNKTRLISVSGNSLTP